ncbi:MAG: hypothetical protein AAF242_14545 [Bacteroidota bacterium]
MQKLLFTLLALVSITNLKGQEAEIKPLEIELSGYLSNDVAEVSGMAWFKDKLILLPQYPEEKGEIYQISKKVLLKYLSKLESGRDPRPLKPKPITFQSQYWKILDGYEGFEALTFDPNSGACWLTIEFEPENTSPYSIIVKGRMGEDMKSLVIDPIPFESYQKQKILSQSKAPNMAEETLVLIPSSKGQKDQILAIHEANGLEGKGPINATILSKNFQELFTTEMPQIPFRITDATDMDADGRFWAINYFYDGDRFMRVSKDIVLEQYGITKGASHQKNQFVERLIELQYKNDQIKFSDSKPIQLELENGKARNWEGIVRLEDKGFLLVSDRFPRTMLIFVKQ